MNKKAVFIGLTLAILLLTLAGAAYAAGTVSIDWWASTGGGGRIESSSLTLDSAIGQGVAGTVKNGSLEVCSGFLCVSLPRKLFLPVIIQ